VHPVLIPGLPFYSYGLLLFIGFMLAYALGTRLARRDGVSQDVIGDLLVITIVTGVVGARILYVILNYNQFHSFLDLFKIWQGGLAFFGGLALAAGSVIAYLRWRRLSIGKVADIVAPCIALGLVFGRIGCFLNGCCWGAVCPERFPLGVKFPRLESRIGETVYATGSYAYLDHLKKGLIPKTATQSLPVYPTQLCASLAAGLICVVLLLARRIRQWNGQIFALFGMLYPAARFVEEIFRADTPPESRWWGLTPFQVISILFFVGSAVVLAAMALRGRAAPRLNG